VNCTPIYPQIAIAEIIAEDENEVRWILLDCRHRAGGLDDRKANEQTGEPKPEARYTLSVQGPEHPNIKRTLLPAIK
jgi:hypothetical protein